jgi:hypothetical protein
MACPECNRDGYDRGAGGGETAGDDETRVVEERHAVDHDPSFTDFIAMPGMVWLTHATRMQARVLGQGACNSAMRLLDSGLGRGPA